jgi:hypothetical protein
METEGDSHSESFSETEGVSYSGSVSMTEGSSLATGRSETDSRGSSENRGSSNSDSYTPLYGFIDIRRDQTGSTEGESRGETKSRGHADSSSTVATRSAAASASEGWESTSSTTHGETIGHSSSVSRGQTVGRSGSMTKGKSTGTSKGHTVGNSSSTGETHGTSESAGYSEGIEPTYADLPTAVHSKENALYFAAQTLRSLKTGSAVFNYVAGEGMKVTMLRVPKVSAVPLLPPEFDALRRQVFEKSPSAIAIDQAVAALQSRERTLIGAAERRKYPAEPSEPGGFRVARAKATNRSHAQSGKDGAQPVKGGRQAVDEGDRDP